MKYLTLLLALLLSGCYGYFERVPKKASYASMSDARYKAIGSFRRMGYKMDDIEWDRLVTKWRTIVIYTPDSPVVAGNSYKRMQINSARTMSGKSPLPRLDPTKSVVIWRFIVEFEKGVAKVTPQCLQQHVVNLQVALYWLPCYDKDVQAMIDSTAESLSEIDLPKE